VAHSMERLAERGWEFFMRLGSLGNVFLAGNLVKLVSKRAEMLSVDIWESVRACAGKIRARD
jgi:hypothetical protein